MIASNNISKLRALRISKGITLSQAADALHISIVTLSQLERKRSNYIKINFIYDLQKMYNLNYAELCDILYELK